MPNDTGAGVGGTGFVSVELLEQFQKIRQIKKWIIILFKLFIFIYSFICPLFKNLTCL
jgi:hypothetical protein